MPISRDHPLRRLFGQLVGRHFQDDAGIAEYVSGILLDFVHVDNLYRIRNAGGKRLEEVGEMLIESNPLLEARSFDRERAVRKHIGDYTLFLIGLFPEYVASLPRRGLRLDSMVDYVKTGKESYRIVSYFDQFEYRNEAPLFRRLSDSFELRVYRLNLVKQDLEREQHGRYEALEGTVELKSRRRRGLANVKATFPAKDRYACPAPSGIERAAGDARRPSVAFIEPYAAPLWRTKIRAEALGARWWAWEPMCAISD